MGTGALHLSDHAPGSTVTVTCPRCDRSATYQIDHLIAEMGEDTPMPHVLVLLTSLWCQGRDSWGGCGAVYEDPIGARVPRVTPGAR